MFSKKLSFSKRQATALADIFLCLLFLSCGTGGCETGGGGNGEVRLATAQDPPPGRMAEPGPDSGIMLGDYNTCKAYADYVIKQLPLGANMLMGMALNFDRPVQCQKAHTCFCLNGLYFIEDFRGESPPVYRCVEPPSAGVERHDIYQSNKPGQGVIKFAMPRSLCD